MSNEFLSNLLGSRDGISIVSDNAKSHGRMASRAIEEPGRRHKVDGRWSCSSDDLLFITNPRIPHNSNNKWDQFSSIRTARRNTIPSVQPPLHKRSPPSVGSRGGLHKAVKGVGASAMRI
mmetsp:Transcript_59738/g.90056  ORF Transcript_59738/g.90056 Transcript_59738/m.90056 type:complete len:120 (-) Transcript_59738:320-679(-)